jgi:uncharacterized protein
LKRLGEFLLAYPKWVLFALTLAAFAAIYPASQIRTDFNLEGFYPEDDRVIEDYELLEREFGRDDNTILIGFSHDSLFSDPVLLDLSEMTDRMKEIESVEEVFSILDARQIKSTNGTLTLDPYMESASGGANPNQLRRELMGDPFVYGFLLGSHGTATAMVLQIDDAENTYPTRNRIIREMEAILDDYRGSYEFHISGIPYFRNQYVNMLNGEIVMYIAISSILIILLLWYIYRTTLGQSSFRW